MTEESSVRGLGKGAKVVAKVERLEEFDVVVSVEGDASHEHDESLTGRYLHRVNVGRPVVVAEMSKDMRHKVATAVLDCFHEHQGIEVLDDFTVRVWLQDGVEIEERDGLSGLSDGMGINVQHVGKLACEVQGG